MRKIACSRLRLCVLIAGVCILSAGFLARAYAQRASRPAGYISGVVESSNGREAGVWVIAETNDLPTKFIKIVVTGDDGRFVLPELPKAAYNIWVRGYGLVDSKPIKASPDDSNVSLKAVLAATPQEAAKVYPADYWVSLIQVPPKSDFPGTGPSGNGISPALTSQTEWIWVLQQGCQNCHQLGTQVTRTITPQSGVASFASSIAAWDHRTQTGLRGTEMTATVNQFGRQRGLKMLADWTDRIAAGEVPPAPPRPRGVERNLVLTMWDWATDDAFVHDVSSTDKRNPRVNGGGPVYAGSNGHGSLVVADIASNTTYEVKIPVRDGASIPPRFPNRFIFPSNYWDKTWYWTDTSEKRAEPHNPMVDSQGRVWATSRVRGTNQPPWCTDAVSNKYAKYFPLPASSNRHVSSYDPKTERFRLIDTCFSTHHLQFDNDPDDTLYFSGGAGVVGWVNTRTFDRTGNEQSAQGWCPTVIDTNGDGRITKPWNEPARRTTGQAEGGDATIRRGYVGDFDSKLDTRVDVGSYGITTNPADRSVWIAPARYPGQIIRLDPGTNPPETCISELYNVPQELDGVRGIDVDRSGVIWTTAAATAQFLSFDRRKCDVLNGPKATGDHCQKGWTVYAAAPGPNLKGTDVRANYFYFNWTDQFNTLGLGENIPIATGTGSDSLEVLLPDKREWLTLRVPYPMGFHHRGMDGRIDDPNAGWKGRGVWATYSTQLLWHTEGGKGTRSKLIHFQVRPDPLAR